MSLSEHARPVRLWNKDRARNAATACGGTTTRFSVSVAQMIAKVGEPNKLIGKLTRNGAVGLDSEKYKSSEAHGLLERKRHVATPQKEREKKTCRRLFYEWVEGNTEV